MKSVAGRMAVVGFVVCSSMLPHAGATEHAAGVTSPSAREVVEELYRLVTFDAGTTPDWDRVRSLFADEAIVVLRTGRDQMTIFSLDGFLNDFAHQWIENTGTAGDR